MSERDRRLICYNDVFMIRPTRDELERLVEEGVYQDRMRSAMRDFCFTIARHDAKQRLWFGNYSVTINRNVTFSFFSRDVRDDPGLEPFPVIRGEHTEVLPIRVRPDPTDPSDDTLVHLFLLAPDIWRTTLHSIERITNDYAALRILPDVYFEDEPLVQLLTERLLTHPAVIADRVADWPSLLK